MLQSVDVVQYTDEEYEKHLADPVGTKLRVSIFNLFIFSLIYFGHRVSYKIDSLFFTSFAISRHGPSKRQINCLNCANSSTSVSL